MGTGASSIRATSYSQGVVEAPQPALRRLFEAVAQIMELDEGKTRLELLFTDGHLTQYWTQNMKRPPGTLARYDGRAAWLIGTVREP